MGVNAQNFVNLEMTALDTTLVMRVEIKFVCLAGEESAVIQPSVKQVVTQSMEPAISQENAFVTLSQAGVENFVISVSCILDVFMEPAVCHGSATVSHSGVDYSVMQILTHADHFLAKMEAFVTTLEQGGTDATAKLDILELTVKQQLTSVHPHHASTMGHATMTPVTFAALALLAGQDPLVK